VPNYLRAYPLDFSAKDNIASSFSHPCDYLQVERSTEEINGHVTTILHLLMKQHAHLNAVQRPASHLVQTASDGLVPARPPHHLRVKPSDSADPLPNTALDCFKNGPEVSPPAPLSNTSNRSSTFQEVEGLEQHPDQPQTGRTEASIVFKIPRKFAGTTAGRSGKPQAVGNGGAVHMRERPAGWAAGLSKPVPPLNATDDGMKEPQQQQHQDCLIPTQVASVIPAAQHHLPLPTEPNRFNSECPPGTDSDAERSGVEGGGEKEVLEGNFGSSRVGNGSQVAIKHLQSKWRQNGHSSSEELPPKEAKHDIAYDIAQSTSPESCKTPTTATTGDGDPNPASLTRSPELLPGPAGAEVERGRWLRGMRRRGTPGGLDSSCASA
jgi:hypothetical protein